MHTSGRVVLGSHVQAKTSIVPGCYGGASLRSIRPPQGWCVSIFASTPCTRASHTMGGGYFREHDVSPCTGGKAAENRVSKRSRRQDGPLNQFGDAVDPRPVGRQSRTLSLYKGTSLIRRPPPPEPHSRPMPRSLRWSEWGHPLAAGTIREYEAHHPRALRYRLLQGNLGHKEAQGYSPTVP